MSGPARDDARGGSGPSKGAAACEGAGALLAVDCTQRISQLAIERAPGGPIVARAFEASPSATSREAFWDALRGIFDEAGLAPASLAAVAVAVGPGGFTGLRVSIAFAKATAYARGIPAVAVPSAELFAASDAARGGRGPWLVALAAKGESAWVEEIESSEGVALGQADRTTPTAGADAIGDSDCIDGVHSGRARIGRPDQIMRASTPASPSGPTPADPSQPTGPHAVRRGRVVDAVGFDEALRAMAAHGGVLLADAHLPEAFGRRAAECGVARRAIATDPRALVACSRARLASGSGADPFELVPLYPREPEAVTKWRDRGRTGR